VRIRVVRAHITFAGSAGTAPIDLPAHWAERVVKIVTGHVEGVRGPRGWTSFRCREHVDPVDRPLEPNPRLLFEMRLTGHVLLGSAPQWRGEFVGGQLSVVDTGRLVGKVFLPTVALGAIKRRPVVMAATARWDLVGRAINELDRLRDRYGEGPLTISLLGHPVAVIINPEQVSRILAAAPDPFTPASSEKVAALRHFQPHGVLISTGAERAERRRVNELALLPDQPEHPHHETMTAIIDREATELLADIDSTGTLDWDRFNETWWRIVRQVVLGRTARDDHELTDLLGTLRRSANWAFAAPVHRGKRARFGKAIGRYFERAEPGSLAGYLAHIPASEGVDPAGQIPHWLFAFDAAGMTAMRALAVLATHPEHADLAARDADYLRACVLDTVRLWPTTPALLRQSTTSTTVGGRDFPAGTTFLMYTPFLHRDRSRLSTADRLDPRGWLEGHSRPGLVPFSAGPARCPGQNVVLHTTSALLARLLATPGLALAEPHTLNPDRLPAALNNFALRFTARTRDRSVDLERQR
jgi:hypothetical protein